MILVRPQIVNILYAEQTKIKAKAGSMASIKTQSFTPKY